MVHENYRDFRRLDGTTYTISPSNQYYNDFKEGRLQVVVRGSINGQWTDTGSVDVNLVGTSVTVTSPNGGENWVQGSVHTVSWSGGDSTGAGVELAAADGSSIGNFGDIGKVSGTSFNWTVGSYITQSSPLCSPSTCPPTPPGQYRFKVYNNDGTFDLSNSPFTISSASILIPCTNAGAVKVGDFNRNGEVSLSETQRMASLSVGSTPSADELKIGDANGDGRITSSDVSVATQNYNGGSQCVLAPVVVQQSITITSPNGGEQWQRGTSYPITWNATNLPSSAQIRIELIKGNYSVLTLSQTANDGTEIWAVPTNITLGTDYRIKVSCVVGDQLCAGGYSSMDYDMSNASFSIVAPPPPSISINAQAQTSGQVGTLLSIPVSITPEATLGGPVIIATAELPAGAHLYRIGDVNRNGSTTQTDATIILRGSQGTYALDAEQRILADVNGDGAITQSDSDIVLQSGLYPPTAVVPNKYVVLWTPTASQVGAATVLLRATSGTVSVQKNVEVTITNPSNAGTASSLEAIRQTLANLQQIINGLYR
jgi:hypothetical protein